MDSVNTSFITGLSRRSVIQYGALAVVSTPVLSANAAIPISVAINRTARFRGNGLRCARAYCQVYLKVLPERSQALLADVQRQIASGFESLNTANFSSDIVPLFKALRDENANLNTALAAPPSKAAVLQASQQADKMFAAANRMVDALQAQSKQTTAKLINQSAFVRNRSARMARNFFLNAAGFDSKDIRDQLASDRADFVGVLNELNKAPISTPSIRNELGLAQSQWVFFEAALNRKADDESMRQVATASERIHDVGDSLTALYDAALKELLGTTG